MATRKQPQQRNGFNAPSDPNMHSKSSPKMNMSVPSMPGSAPNNNKGNSDFKLTDPQVAQTAASTAITNRPGMNPTAIAAAVPFNPRPGMMNVYGDGIVSNLATNPAMSLNPGQVPPSGRMQGNTPLTHKETGGFYNEVPQLVPEQDYEQLTVAYNQMNAAQKGSMAPNAMGLGTLPTQADMTPPPQDLTLQGVTSADPVAMQNQIAMQQQAGMNLNSGAQNQAPLNA